MTNEDSLTYWFRGFWGCLKRKFKPPPNNNAVSLDFINDWPTYQGYLKLPKMGSSLLERAAYPTGPPTLKGKEAEAFLEDASKPPTEQQLRTVKEALKRFPHNSKPYIEPKRKYKKRQKVIKQ